MVLIHLHDLLPETTAKDGDISSWAVYARDHIQWSILIKGEISREEYKHGEQSPPSPSARPQQEGYN